MPCAGLGIILVVMLYPLPRFLTVGVLSLNGYIDVYKRQGYGHESGRRHETVESHRFRKQDRALRRGFHGEEKADKGINDRLKRKTEKRPE